MRTAVNKKIAVAFSAVSFTIQNFPKCRNLTDKAHLPSSHNLKQKSWPQTESQALASGASDILSTFCPVFSTYH